MMRFNGINTRVLGMDSIGIKCYYTKKFSAEREYTVTTAVSQCLLLLGRYMTLIGSLGRRVTLTIGCIMYHDHVAIGSPFKMKGRSGETHAQGGVEFGRDLVGTWYLAYGDQ